MISFMVCIHIYILAQNKEGIWRRGKRVGDSFCKTLCMYASLYSTLLYSGDLYQKHRLELKGKERKGVEKIVFLFCFFF